MTDPCPAGGDADCATCNWWDPAEGCTWGDG
jgi:hypothetical protein